MIKGFRIQKEDQYAIVYTETEKIQSINAPLLKSELVMLIKSGIKNIIVDMADTRYCDSSGLSALLTGNRLSHEADGSFVLSSLQPSVEKLVAISQLTSVFDIVPTKDEAIDVVLMEEIERELRTKADDKS
ncbi:MAG: anti-sigma B factor antagonist [Cryomorphaceae bacterium]|jgi:anti-anti-sigma factor